MLGLVSRSWIRVMLGLWAFSSLMCYWWFISNINVKEEHGRTYAAQASAIAAWLGVARAHVNHSQHLSNFDTFETTAQGPVTNVQEARYKDYKVQVLENQLLLNLYETKKEYDYDSFETTSRAVAALKIPSDVVLPVMLLDKTKENHDTFNTTSRVQVPIFSDAVGTLCETIHIALVCMNNCIQQITPMLKSLLHHRQNPLHFHMILSETSLGIVSEMFDSWELPDVKYTCYNAQPYLFNVMWISNMHYSGVYALVKLLIPDILPVSLDQVIVIDSDLIFMCDVAELWDIFKDMSEEQVIGMVQNESNWYLSEYSMFWPALGRGYNTGVMLLDLKMLRAMNWTARWHDAVKEYFSTEDNTKHLYAAVLADQDVFNAVIKKYPSMVYPISCQYNVQLSIHSLAKYCFREDARNVKIIHWNSPYRQKIKMRDAEFFKSIHKSYENFDGYLLREKLHMCDQFETVKIEYKDCVSIRTAQHMKLRIHPHYTNQFNNDPIDDFDVTLVLHLSLDRIQFLERLALHWEGPMSAAIYLSDGEMPIFRRYIREKSKILIPRWNIDYHLVYKHDAVPYPVNYLRNVAMQHTRTPYLFLMDVELLPSTGLYKHLQSVIQLNNPHTQKKCLVVPAFQMLSFHLHPPTTKAELVSRLVERAADGDVAPFRVKDLWPTNYTRWITAALPYEVEWQPDYEPYLVVHRSVPQYDTRYSGFEWNKMSHSVDLHAQGYSLMVLSDAFVVNTLPSSLPGIVNLDISLHPHYNTCLEVIKQEFMADLTRRYNITFSDGLERDSLRKDLLAWKPSIELE